MPADLHQLTDDFRTLARLLENPGEQRHAILQSIIVTVKYARQSIYLADGTPDVHGTSKAYQHWIRQAVQPLDPRFAEEALRAVAEIN